MTHELTRLRARYAKARDDRRQQGEWYYRTKSQLHDELAHEVAMIRARAALADLQHTRRDILTLRETMASGGMR